MHECERLLKLQLMRSHFTFEAMAGNLLQLHSAIQDEVCEMILIESGQAEGLCKDYKDLGCLPFQELYNWPSHTSDILLAASYNQL